MPKTVYRSTLRLVRESKDVPFYQASEAMNNIRAEFKESGKVLNYYYTLSEDELTRTFLIDFKDEQSRIDFRALIAVDDEMRSFYMYNSINNIVTYIDEEYIETSDYD
jgi:hypothetical protein